MNKISCPVCGSYEIVMTYDLEHNVHILKCNQCGDLYAIRDEDLHTLGFEHVIREWRESCK